MNDQQASRDEPLDDLEYYVAYVCPQCKAQFVGRGSHEARFCHHCGAPKGGEGTSDMEETSGPRQVLLVEDSQVLRSALGRMIRSLGHEVVEAVDGVDGLEKARQQRPDLVITDLNMPRMDGLQLIEKLREDQRTQGIPIIVMTSETGSRTIAKSLANNVTDYIVKDISRIKDIRNRLKRYL